MRTIGCEIQTLSAQNEEAWIISIDSQNVEKTALMFSALFLECVPKIVFQDCCSNRSFVLQKDSAMFGNRHVLVGECWIKALWRLLLDTHLNGWTDTAHIDQDFDTLHGSISITFAIK